MSDYEWLRPFCNTDAQRLLLDYLKKNNTVRETSDHYGVSERNIYAQLKRLKKRAARQGVDPGSGLDVPVANGFGISRMSTLRDADGEIKLRWDRQEPDKEARAEMMREFVAELCENVKPRKATKAPKHAEADIMCGYPIGDHHFGMYAWARETGAPYDTETARQLLADAIDHLVESAPPAETALLCNLGDYLHGDDSSNSTKRSHHQLDIDTRYARVHRIAAFGLAHTIERLLKKHQLVKIVNVKGNHDEDSAAWLSTVLLAWFRNEPRVEVEDSPAEILFHQFGRNMIGMTHGHNIKLERMPQVMAALAPEMWGDTTYRVGWQGHVHHSQRLAVKEDGGAIAETFGVLPPNDKYSASQGFSSQREMHCITFRESGGVLCRTTYNAELNITA